MASIYTDEIRIAHYESCKKRARRCELIFGICMCAMILIALAEIGNLLIEGVFDGILQGEFGLFFARLCTAAVTVFSLLAIYRRSLRLLVGALLAACICAVTGLFVMFGVITPFLLLPAVIAGVSWNKLGQEEGFPQFEITYSEKVDRQRVEEIRIRARMEKPEQDEIMDELEQF